MIGRQYSICKEARVILNVFASGSELDENQRMALVFAWLLYCGRE